jgi:ribosomal protein L16 Arg81 hydroxylase
MSPHGEELARLLDPVDLDTFMSMHWERASLYIPGSPGKFADLFSLEKFFRSVALVDRADPRGPDISVDLKAGYQGPDDNHYELVIRPEQIRPLLGAGLTIQAERLETADRGLGALARSLKEAIRIASRVDVGGFLSPDRGGYALHFDAPAMWILQIAGAKRWWYAPRPVVPFPLYNRGPTADERKQGVGGLYREEDMQEQLLRTGDVLYLPGGTWHRVQAAGQSLHLCLTVRPSNYLRLVNDVLSPLLLSLADWRHLPAPPAAPGDLEQMDPQLEALFAERLLELRAAVGALTAADLYRAWRDRARPV